MAPTTPHLSASATQIYPSSDSASRPHSTSASAPASPPHSTSSARQSDFALDPLSAEKSQGHGASGDTHARRTRILDIARLALTVLSIGAAAAVVGCEAHTLSLYNATRLDDGFFLPPLWPVNFDLRPTQGLVVGGAVVALAGLVCVLLGVVPMSPRLNLLKTLFSVSLSLIGLAGAIFGVAYSSYITNRPDYDRDNIQSWTCRWVEGAADVNKLFAGDLADIAAPQGFKRVCTESHVGFSLLAILICLETLILVLTGLCAWMEIRTRRSERSLAGSDSDEKDVRVRRFW